MGMYIYGGDNITIQNSEKDYGLRQPVVLGKLSGVTATKSKKGDPVTLVTKGVYEFAKASKTDGIKVGDAAYFKESNDEFVFTKTETGNTRFGVFVADSGSGDDGPVRVLINPYDS